MQWFHLGDQRSLQQIVVVSSWTLEERVEHIDMDLGVIQREWAFSEGILKCVKTSSLLSAGPQEAMRIDGRKDFVGISRIG